MEAVGRLGSYLSERVYTVAAPFDPFGGAVDIIVVQQEDGTYKSSPWYVKFGKFQGVLKRREKIVNVSVNGVEADFHMFLDHRGVAYLLQELDNNEEESGFSPPSAPSSGDERGAKKNNRPPSGSKKKNSSLRKNGDPTEENDTLEAEDVSALSYGSPDHQDNNEVDIKRMSSDRSDVSRQSSQLLSDTSGSMLSNERSISMVPSRRRSIFNLFRGRSRSYSEAHVASSQNESIQRISSLERAEQVTDLIDSKWAIGISDKTQKVSAEKDYEMNSFSSSDNTLAEEDEFPGPVDKASGDLSCCEKADDSDASPDVVKARDTEKLDLDAADYNVVVNDTVGESFQQNALESGQTNEFKLQEFCQTSLGNPNTCISKLDYASQSDVMKFQRSEEVNIFAGEPEHKEFYFLEHVSFPSLFECNDDNDVQIVETNIGQMLFEETERIRVKLVTQDSSLKQEPYNAQDRSLNKSLRDSNLDGNTGKRTVTEDLMTMPEELIPEVKVLIEYESEFCFTKRKDGKASPEECLIFLEQNQPKVVETDTVAIELNETMDNELGKATLVALPSDKLSRSKEPSESAKQCNCIDIMGKNDVVDFCDNAKNIDYPHVTLEERRNQQKTLSASDASCGSSPLGDSLQDPWHTACIEIDSESKCTDIYLKQDSACTVKCGEQDQSGEALPETKLHQDSSSYSSIETEKVSLTNKDSDTRYLESVSCENEQEGMNSTSVTIVENRVDRTENADFKIQSQAINLERAQECTSISDTHAQKSSDSPLRLNKNYLGPLRKDSECQTEEELELEFNDESVLNGCLSLSELQPHSVVELEVNNTSTCIENEPGHDTTDMNCNENQKLRFSDQGNETVDAKSRITISYFNGSQMSQSVSIEKSPLYEPKKENIGVDDIIEPSSSVRTTGNNLFVIEDPSHGQSLDGDTSVLGGVGLKLACSAPENQQSNSLEDTTRQEFSPTQNYTEEKGDWIATAAAITSMQSSSGVEISLCKHLLQEGMGVDAAAEVFISQRVSLEDFENSAKEITKNEKLVVKIEGQYFPWNAAAPIILSIAAFGFEDTLHLEGSIPVERVHKAVTRCPSDPIATPGGWRWMLPFSRTRTPERSNSAPLTPNDKLLAGAASKNFDRNMSTKNGFNGKKGRNLRVNTPTSEQLASLNLKEGKNIITFTFTTRLFGRQQVDARIFLWKWNTKIVISDVDGTITRSDVLGQFMPLVGKDWTQCGVAHLFSAIKDNGYQVLFLSARALAQACLTRQFLINIKQDGKALPDGPVVISPDGLFPSLYREVIRRTPHEFKIACLERIKALFPSHCNPFYAGFGNRDTDEISYLRVGIPKGKIFIINPKGEVVVNHRVDTKSYISLHKLVHGMFPAMSYNEQEDFNSWNFWKVPVHEIDL